MSPRMELLIFAVVVAVVFTFLTGLLGIYFRSYFERFYLARYLIVIIAVALFALLIIIRDGLRRRNAPNL